MTDKAMDNFGKQVEENDEFILDIWGSAKDFHLEDMQGDWDAESWGTRINGEAREFWLSLYEFDGNWKTFDAYAVGKALHNEITSDELFLALDEDYRAIVTVSQDREFGDEFPRVTISVAKHNSLPRDVYVHLAYDDIKEGIGVTKVDNYGKSKPVACINMNHADDDIAPTFVWDDRENTGYCLKCQSAFSPMEMRKLIAEKSKRKGKPMEINAESQEPQITQIGGGELVEISTATSGNPTMGIGTPTDDYESMLSLDKVNIDLDTSGDKSPSDYGSQIKAQLIGRFEGWWTFTLNESPVAKVPYRNEFLLTFRNGSDKTVIAFGVFSLIYNTYYSIEFVDPEGGDSFEVSIPSSGHGIRVAVGNMVDNGLASMIWDYIEG